MPSVTTKSLMVAADRLVQELERDGKDFAVAVIEPIIQGIGFIDVRDYETATDPVEYIRGVTEFFGKGGDLPKMAVAALGTEGLAASPILALITRSRNAMAEAGSLDAAEMAAGTPSAELLAGAVETWTLIIVARSSGKHFLFAREGGTWRGGKMAGAAVKTPDGAERVDIPALLNGLSDALRGVETALTADLEALEKGEDYEGGDDYKAFLASALKESAESKAREEAAGEEELATATVRLKDYRLHSADGHSDGPALVWQTGEHHHAIPLEWTQVAQLMVDTLDLVMKQKNRSAAVTLLKAFMAHRDAFMATVGDMSVFTPDNLIDLRGKRTERDAKKAEKRLHDAIFGGAPAEAENGAGKPEA